MLEMFQLFTIFPSPNENDFGLDYFNYVVFFFLSVFFHDGLRLLLPKNGHLLFPTCLNVFLKHSSINIRTYKIQKIVRAVLMGSSKRK